MIPNRRLMKQDANRDASCSLSRVVSLRAALLRTEPGAAVGVAVPHKESRYDYDG
jgi:hypothetical protein